MRFLAVAIIALAAAGVGGMPPAMAQTTLEPWLA